MLAVSKIDHAVAHVVQDIQTIGYSIIENVLHPELISQTTEHLYQVEEKIVSTVGKEKLDRAREIGVLRLMMKYDPFFITFLNIPLIHEIVAHTVSDTAIMHLQNGFINPPVSKNVDTIAQYQFHRDFPRIMNGYMASINIMVAVTEFTKDNGGTLIVPGTQQKDLVPSDNYLREKSIAVECLAGSLVVFDSTLIHAASRNTTNRDRLGINHQFTRSFIKQQFDYVRAIGLEIVEKQTPKAQQMLGYYTRVVTSLDEYYKPENERLYRKGQG